MPNIPLDEIGILTVDGKVAEGGAGGSLHLNIRTLEKEQNRIQCVSVDFSYI